MNSIKKVSILTGGGGAPLNRVHNGRDIIVLDNNRRSCCDNAAVAYR